MNCSEKHSEQEMEVFIDGLAEFIRANQPGIRVLDPSRFGELLTAKKAFDSLLAENDEKPSEIELHSLLGSIGVSAEVDELEIRDIRAFQQIASRASNFEIYPLVNGKTRIAFLFSNVLIPLE